MKTLGHAYIGTRMRMHALDLHMQVSCMCRRTHGRVPETIKDNFFYIKVEVWNESHIV